MQRLVPEKTRHERILKAYSRAMRITRRGPLDEMSWVARLSVWLELRVFHRTSDVLRELWRRRPSGEAVKIVLAVVATAATVAKLFQ